MSLLLPENNPTSGTSATPAPAPIGVTPTGGAGAASTPVAKPSNTERSESEILNQFLADLAEETPEAQTTPPDGDHEEGTNPEDPEAGSTTEEVVEGAESTSPDTPNGKAADDPKGHLAHLIDAILKDPEKTDSAAYKRAVKILGEPATLKQELAEARAKLAEVNGPPVVVREPSAEEPLAHIATVEQLQQELRTAQGYKANAEAWIEWLGDNKEGGTPPGHKEPLDADTVREKLAEARGILRAANARIEAAPSKKEWLAKYGETRKAIVERRPELLEKGNAEMAEAVKLITEGRVGSAHAEHIQDALDLLRGRRDRLEEEQGVKKVKVDGKAVATKAAAPGNGAGAKSSTTSNARPGPQGGGVTRGLANRPAGAGYDLKALKEAKAKGDPAALGKLIDAFAGS
jgi:hypothetical protein